MPECILPKVILDRRQFTDSEMNIFFLYFYDLKDLWAMTLKAYLSCIGERPDFLDLCGRIQK